MSFSYSGNPSESRLDECRFLISDTDEKNMLFSDEEINFIISQSGSNDNLLKYTLFTQAATVYAKAIKRTLGPQSEDPTARLNFFKQQADNFKNKLTVGGVSAQKYAHPKVFHRGMQNNPPYGRGDGIVRKP